MTIASDLLQRHIQTLVDDNTQWQTLIADDVLWDLAYAQSIGHPAQLSGREEAVRHAIWFVGAVENFRFFELKVYALADPERAVAEVKGEGSSSLRDVCIARIMCYSCVLWAARSRSYENISIPCARLGHLTRQSLISNPYENRRRSKASFSPRPDPTSRTYTAHRISGALIPGRIFCRMWCARALSSRTSACVARPVGKVAARYSSYRRYPAAVTSRKKSLKIVL